jgi:hypothetical protein
MDGHVPSDDADNRRSVKGPLVIIGCGPPTIRVQVTGAARPRRGVRVLPYPLPVRDGVKNAADQGGDGQLQGFEELKSGLRVRGLVAGLDVNLIAVEFHGDGMANVVYRNDAGAVAERLVSSGDLAGLEAVSGRRWTFDGDAAGFKLASEARRIELAHLFDPYSGVESSTIDPLPHQIEAVYGRLLPLQPLKFLLADDPGAGKTIMSGLLIRE